VGRVCDSLSSGGCRLRAARECEHESGMKDGPRSRAKTRAQSVGRVECVRDDVDVSVLKRHWHRGRVEGGRVEGGRVEGGARTAEEQVFEKVKTDHTSRDHRGFRLLPKRRDSGFGVWGLGSGGFWVLGWLGPGRRRAAVSMDSS
jgi:hypothetical protein